MTAITIGYNDLANILGESFSQLLKEPKLINKIIQIAKRLEALQEYHPRQALFVAADIVRWRFIDSIKPDFKKEKKQ